MSKLRFITGCALLGSILGHLLGGTEMASIVGAAIFLVAGMVSVIIE